MLHYGGETSSVPRTADGQPDIQGFWANQGRRLATYNIQAMDGASETHTLISGVQSDPHSLIVDPADGRIPYQPWAQAKRQDIFDNHNNPTKWEHVDPHTLCWLSGIPRMFYQGMTQILQIPGSVIVLQEFNHAYRVIPLDGRPHVPANVKLWMGDSRGRWEGDTLVVESTNFRDDGWLDVNGAPLTSEGKIIERFRRPNAGTLEIDVTIDDPKAYTRPFTVRVNQRLLVDQEMIEFICNENERSTEHLEPPAWMKGATPRQLGPNMPLKTPPAK